MDGAAISAEQGDLAATAPSQWSAWDSIGRAIARGSTVSVCGGLSQPQSQTGGATGHYPKNDRHGARTSTRLILITPGGPSTRHLVNAEVLEALGPRGSSSTCRAARWSTMQP